jgi:hypothetical protein
MFIEGHDGLKSQKNLSNWMKYAGMGIGTRCAWDAGP